jgi:ubiquinone biosynthesis protein UbiJ
MSDDDFRTILRAIDGLQAEFAPVREQLKIIEIKVSGIPLIAESTHDLRRDLRMVKAAINDMARVNITAGEVEALHEEIDKIQAENAELATRLATVERLLADTGASDER